MAFIRKIWQDPVWSNVIAAMIISFLSTIPLFVRAAINKTAFNALVSGNFVFSAPLWGIYAFLLLAITIITLLRIRNTPRYIKVRYDWIDSSCIYCFVSFQYDGLMSLNEFIDLVIESFEEDNIKDYHFGKDWFLFDTNTKKNIDERSYQALSKLGIKRGGILELHRTKWGNWKES